MGDRVLSYNDAILYRSDLQILENTCYLNDQIITFYFTYLSSIYHANDISLVPPAVSFWPANSDDKEYIKNFLNPLNFPDKRIVIFTVNDADPSIAGTGTHWSILAYDRDKNTFFHFDSMAGANRSHAIKLYDSVKGCLNTSVGKTSEGDEAAASFVEPASPQQRNGYDCGLYVLAIARVICQWHTSGSLEKGHSWVDAVLKLVDSSIESTLRSEILQLIDDLRFKR